MTKNSPLHRAKRVKDDEFYTRFEDVVAELQHYAIRFNKKTIYANCDGPEYSAFAKYFSALKEAGFIADFKCSSDDFRAPHNMKTLREADIICTNPPFSLFREYFTALIENGKKFIIIGDINAVKYKEVLPYLKSGEVWLGHDRRMGHRFGRPDGTEQYIGTTVWFTNIPHANRYKDLELTAKYDPRKYPTYDNLNAINVDRTKDIPCDYWGWIGVPISFFAHHNPDQFHIIGRDCFIQRPEGKGGVKINGKNKFARIIIQRKVTGTTNI